MFCHACKQLLQNETMDFCPYCGAPQHTIVKVAKFELSSESLFQSSIQSLNDLGITIDQVDKEEKNIETIDVTKSPIGSSNKLQTINIKITEEADSISVITVSIFTNDAALAADRFNKLIFALESSKLSQAAEIGFGFGALIVARLTPSVQISGIIGLLSIVITILLYVHPSKSRIVVLLALSIVNILLSLWVVNQLPQLLYELFVVLVLGMIFNVVSLIYSAYVYGKIDR